MFGYANPKRYAKLTRWILPLAGIVSATCFVWGLYLSLIVSPPDYQQSESVRIMYIHVPAAWVSMFTYASMGVAALVFMINKHLLAGLYIRAVAPIGAAFTFICLVTGALWGQPTWGTWWVWDARLTSVLILFFLYAGLMALYDAFDDEDKGMKAASWLTIIGLVNLPIIKFSVDWWNTLHQTASLTSFSKMANPSIDPSMLTPLLVMSAAYMGLFGALAIIRLENEMRRRRIENLRLRKAAHV